MEDREAIDREMELIRISLIPVKHKVYDKCLKDRWCWRFCNKEGGCAMWSYIIRELSKIAELN